MSTNLGARTILALNAGSSSIKCAVFSQGGDGEDLMRLLEVDVTGLPDAPSCLAVNGDGARLAGPQFGAHEIDPETILERLLDWLAEYAADFGGISAVGHRVVHGGMHFSGPVAIDAEVLARLAALEPLAPKHQPHNLMPAKRLYASRPELLQVACFDTAFHRTQPPVAQWYALPRRYRDEGIIRYGFHGLSYEYIARVLPGYDAAAARGRTIVAHLGHGASLCALQAGRSVATTMGFTTLDGLPMGRRSGALDPGIVLHLIGSLGFSVEEVEDLLNHQSGIYGVSGVSDNMRELLNSDSPAAREAIDLFVYRAVREIGSLTAALGGLDALIFTAGVGEHAPEIRRRIAEGLTWLGLRLEPRANERNDAAITTPDSAVRGWVIPTDEERMLAEHTLAIYQSRRAMAIPRQRPRGTLPGTAP